MKTIEFRNEQKYYFVRIVLEKKTIFKSLTH